MKFENEVRACLNEQLTYVSELQTEMFKQVETLRHSFKEISWQMAKEEDKPKLESSKKLKPNQQTLDLILDFFKAQNLLNERTHGLQDHPLI